MYLFELRGIHKLRWQDKVGKWYWNNNNNQGRNRRENLDATSAMVGRICPLVGIGLSYLKI